MTPREHFALRILFFIAQVVAGSSSKVQEEIKTLATAFHVGDFSDDT